MPSIPVSFKEAKESVDKRTALSEIPDKRKREERKSQKVRKPKGEEKQHTKRRYAKRRAVKALRRTWFLLIWVPNIIKILLKKNFKSKQRLLVKTPT